MKPRESASRRALRAAHVGGGEEPIKIPPNFAIWEKRGRLLLAIIRPLFHNPIVGEPKANLIGGSLMPGPMLGFTRVAALALIAAGITGAAQNPPPATMGACGKMNVRRADYLTAAECAKRGGIFLEGIKPYPGMFVISY